MVVVQDDPMVWCDPCLVPLISALNQGGVRTVASCCGHGSYLGWVLLGDDQCLLLATREEVDRIENIWSTDPNAAGYGETSNDEGELK